jgi:hypothetical protein
MYGPSVISSQSAVTDPFHGGRWLASLMVRLPECAETRSLRPADRTRASPGASLRTSTRSVVSLPVAYTPSEREMHRRHVYLRSGLTVPSKGWVIDSAPTVVSSLSGQR